MLTDQKMDLNELRACIPTMMTKKGIESLSSFFGLKRNTLLNLSQHKEYITASLPEAFKKKRVDYVHIRFYKDIAIGMPSTLEDLNAINNFIDKYQVQEKDVKKGETFLSLYRKECNLLNTFEEVYKIGFLLKADFLNSNVNLKHSLLRMICTNKSVINEKNIVQFCKIKNLDNILQNQKIIDDILISKYLLQAKNTTINVDMLLKANYIAKKFKFDNYCPNIVLKLDELINTIPKRFENVDLKTLNLKSTFWKKNALFNTILDKNPYKNELKNVTTFELWNDMTNGLSRVEENIDEDEENLTSSDFLQAHIEVGGILSHIYTHPDLPIPKT